MDSEAGRSFRIGVDIGGTFTDIVWLGDNGALFSNKQLPLIIEQRGVTTSPARVPA